MPCRTEEPYEVKPKKPMETVQGLEAALCGFLTALTKNGDIQRAVDFFDEAEAGIEVEEVIEWWRVHQAKDEARKKREHEARMRETAKQRALAKLTPEEKALLNLR